MANDVKLLFNKEQNTYTIELTKEQLEELNQLPLAEDGSEENTEKAALGFRIGWPKAVDFCGTCNSTGERHNIRALTHVDAAARLAAICGGGVSVRRGKC